MIKTELTVRQIQNPCISDPSRGRLHPFIDTTTLLVLSHNKGFHKDHFLFILCPVVSEAIQILPSYLVFLIESFEVFILVIFICFAD